MTLKLVEVNLLAVSDLLVLRL